MLNNTKEALDDFKNYVIQQARTNLTKNKINVDKKLYNSLQGFVEESSAGFRLYFEMEDYGMFQDRGVTGKNKKYTSLSGFSYKNKRPPSKPLAEWAKRRNIRLRDDKGRFKKGNYDTIGFLIARSIYENGLKPTLFFTKPFERAIKRLPEDLQEAFGDDLKNML
jgi:mRNA-degrading endonuclease RelE of RelBE toxin-antitoxin system